MARMVPCRVRALPSFTRDWSTLVPMSAVCSSRPAGAIAATYRFGEGSRGRTRPGATWSRARCPRAASCHRVGTAISTARITASQSAS